MASPQTENGHTKIANELLDALIKWHLSGYEWRVLLWLIRKTYGWNKKSDWVSLSQFSEATGIKVSHISRALNMLQKQNIITKGGNWRKPLFGVQKDWEKWMKLPKGVRSHHVTKGGNSSLPKGVIGGQKGGAHKRNIITKETITKDITHSAQPKDEVNELFKLFYDSVNPNINYAHKGNRDAAQWLIEKYGLQKVLNAAKFAISVQGKPYSPTINTPVQLKNKMADLIAYQQKQLNQPKGKSYDN